MPLVFAEEQTVRIPTGAASPSCTNDDSCYVPSKIIINEGNEVEWMNEDSTAHTVTSGVPGEGHDGLFDSGIIVPRSEFEFTFNGFDVGTYPYYCTAHPWMVGNVTIVNYSVEMVSEDSDVISESESEYSFDENDAYERNSSNHISKSDAQPTLLENQRMFGKYKVTVDWIRDLPAVNEINGIEILVSDMTKKSSHVDSMKGMKDHGNAKGKHGESSHDAKGKHDSSNKCGGVGHGNDEENHGNSMKGKSGHDYKEMKGHEGGCPHFQMIKKMIPQIELLENGVSQVDRSMKITLSVGSNELTMPVVADENLPGRYAAVFVPTVTGKYGLEVHGTIHGSPVNMTIEMDKVLDKNQVTKFP